MTVENNHALESVLEKHPALQKFITNISDGSKEQQQNLALLAQMSYYMGFNDGMAKVMGDLFNCAVD